jgi:hypothetical protein
MQTFCPGSFMKLKVAEILQRYCIYSKPSERQIYTYGKLGVLCLESVGCGVPNIHLDDASFYKRRFSSIGL